MEIMIILGEFIKNERHKQNLSLAQLSEKAFGHQYYATIIGKIEKAKRPKTTFETIDKVLSALGYELKELFLNNN